MTLSLGAVHFIVGVVMLQRLSELRFARRNTARLLAAGGVEVGAGHYPLFIGLHAAWLAALAVAVPATVWPSQALIWVLVTLQLGRAWVIAALGPRWTTRIVVLPGVPPVRRGPYRYVRHPNYAIVAGEIAVLPLAFGAWRIALVFTILNALLLAHRIRVENQALAAAEAPGARFDTSARKF